MTPWPYRCNSNLSDPYKEVSVVNEFLLRLLTVYRKVFLSSVNKKAFNPSKGKKAFQFLLKESHLQKKKKIPPFGPKPTSPLPHPY